MHLMGGPGSGDGPTPEEVQAWRRRFQPPENEVPGLVGPSLVVGRTDDVAVVLTGVRVYSTGSALDVAVRLRREPRHGGEVYDLVSGDRYGEDVDVDRLLLVGVELPDGRRATSLRSAGWPGPGAEEVSDAPALSSTGGGGGGRSYDQSYWLHPVPPPGPLVVVCSWPAFGIPEGRATVDGAALADAASRVLVLWPDEPEELTPYEAPEPPTPSSGWFADAVRRRGRP